MDVFWVMAAHLAPGGTAYIVSKVVTLQGFCAQAIAIFSSTSPYLSTHSCCRPENVPPVTTQTISCDLNVL